ncbi:hypothetical protein CKK34_2224 [Yarrowia sp. E02]|nr:hypothetical protein CKK34_2224 [Yarrowia sp. E02]
MIPLLPVPASKDECVLAMNRLIEDDGIFYQKWIPKKDALLTKLVEDSEKLGDFERRFQLVGAASKFRGPLESMMLETRRETSMWSERYKPVDCANKLQLVVQGLVNNQEKELKRLFLTSCLPFGSHLDRKPTSKPVVTLEEKGWYSASDIPFDIASAIYAHCSAETCVALRQTSWFWYMAYQQSDHELKDVLAARNPWFIPQGDLTTWGDCLLVFVKRLATWETAKTFEEMNLTPIKPPPQRLLTAGTLEFGDRAPEGFSTLNSHEPVCQSYNCGKLHSPYKHTRAVIDLCTHESRLFDPSSITLESAGKDTVLKVDDFEKVNARDSAGIEMLLPGYDGDKFQVWYVEHEVAEKYALSAWGP